jgi:hypothetical protein
MSTKRLSPLGSKYGERVIDGVKTELRTVFEGLRQEALSDGYPPGTVPLPKSPVTGLQPPTQTQVSTAPPLF